MDKKIKQTSDYSKFHFSISNRDVNLNKAKAKKLRHSLKKYGWIDSFPMTCYKNGKSTISILDGQHRFSIARELGMPVKYVVIDQVVEVSEINNTQDTWSIKDYMNRWIKEGHTDYEEIEKFKNKYSSLSIGTCIALLSGTANYSGDISDKFETGNFKVTHKEYAYEVAETYRKITEANTDVKNRNLVRALHQCYKVEDFDPERLIDSCQKRPHLLVSYSKVDDFLEMIEEIYNYSLKTGRIPLKFLAKEAN